MALITGYDHYGRGITKIDNKICFVENAMIDDDVEVNITNEKKNFNECTIKKFNKMNPNRVENICPYYQKCGGCNILHMNYEDQLKFKEEKVKNIVHKYLKDLDIKINDIVRSDDQFHYRNKITLHRKDKKIGLYNKNSNDVVAIDNCLLLDNQLNMNLKNINDYLIMRTNGKEILNDINDSIICTIGDYKYYVSLKSFFQVNTNVTKKLYDKVKELANLDNENLLDLYCGTGTIGIYLASDANKVLGIEISKDSISDAMKNKKLNNVKNIEFICGDVAKAISKVNFNPDVIVVDPPRAGLDFKTREFLNNSNAKRIVYVSCDPMTFVRDLNELKEKYNIKEITPFDMFPNTYHVENIAVLYLKEQV